MYGSYYSPHCPQPLAKMLFLFGAVMMTVAFLSSFKDLLPEVQELPGERFQRLNNKHLEDIAPNPEPGELARPAKTAHMAQVRTVIREQVLIYTALISRLGDRLKRKD
jgi:hypothetical protein